MIRILLADDHAIVRSGLRQIVSTTSDIVIAAEATHGREVIGKLRSCAVDLLLLDMTMHDVSGIDMIRRVRAERPSLPVLALSIYDGGAVASRALRAGATGYLTKDSDPETLLAAIRKLAGGGRLIDPTLVDALVFETYRADVPPHDALSDREFQVLQMLAEGGSINAIADSFALSERTVSRHKMRLMQKLGLANNAEVIRYAIRHGLVVE